MHETTSSLLLSAARILEIFAPDITQLTLQIVSAESTLHALFRALSPYETERAFANCWPIYDPVQTKEFRVVAYKWLSDLKAKGHLGSTIVRKSLLDDRQGERYELLLLALASYILRQRLPEGFRGSRQVVLSSNPDVELLRVHCLIHTYQLSRDARRRKQVREDTRRFAQVLVEQETRLDEKDRKRKTHLDYDSIVNACAAEKSRWERNWTSIKGEWILESLRNSLSPTPPIDFLSQSYEDAFSIKTPSSTKPSWNIISGSSTQCENSISALQAQESLLQEEITRLESIVGPATPPRKSSVRKSMPPTKSLPPSVSTSPSSTKSNGSNLRFSRSASRLSTASISTCESKSPRTMDAEHARTLEALNNALNALQRDHESEKCRSEGIGERGKEGDERKMERSGIPRRLVSVGSRAG